MLSSKKQPRGSSAFKWLSLGLLALTAWVSALIIWRQAPVYPPVVDLPVQCESSVPLWSGSRPLKVMSFNVQFMAGKEYVFYYDQGQGNDRRPTKKSVYQTLDKVAERIRAINPDLVLLQEVNGSDDSRTHYIDQLVELQQRLGELAYPCQTSAYYWKAGFVPHPKIMGSVAMKLVTLSRYAITTARRHQLPLMENDPITQHFYFQRAVLEVRLKSAQGGDIAVMNTHFDAWGEGSGLMQRQVDMVMAIIENLESKNTPWILAGDFNMLPPDGNRQWQRLQNQYDENSPLQSIYDRYGAVPLLNDLQKSDAYKWYTHFPNDPQVAGPDRTIDYLFYDPVKWRLISAFVDQQHSLDISDHLPVVAELTQEP